MPSLWFGKPWTGIAAVALLGPRQVGKTTLARAVGEQTGRFVVYSGDERFPVSADLEAIGLRELAQAVAAAA